MQDRYVGDVKDYAKYALLRYLQKETGLTLGINWYYTDPDKLGEDPKKHGGDRSYLRRNGNCRLDSDLFDALQAYPKPPAKGALKKFQSNGILPAKFFVGAHVPCFVDARKKWHKKAVTDLESADLVFLDPDTGMHPRKSPQHPPKYVFYSELADYVKREQAVICIQFPQYDKSRLGADVKFRRQMIHEVTGKDTAIDVVRVMRENNVMVLFFIIVPEEFPKKEKVKSVLAGFLKKNPNFCLHT